MSERILLVDDEPHILTALQRLLRNGLKNAVGERYQVELSLIHISDSCIRVSSKGTTCPSAS